MKLEVDEERLRALREALPIVRQYAEATERDRRLAEPAFDALAAAGCFRLYVPRAFGGHELDPVSCARIVEESAAADSAAGWAVMVANAIAWWAARLPDEGAEEIYGGGSNVIVAAAFHPPVEAEVVPGGFRLRGRRPLASGIHRADWLMVTARATASTETRGAIVRTRECRIHDTWYALGMRGTDSNDVELVDVEVPRERTFALTPEFSPGTHYRGALYRMPAMGAALATWATVSLAVARRALDEVVVMARAKTPLGSASLLRDRPAAQAKIGMAEAILRSARAFLYDEIGEAWRRTVDGTGSTLEQKADLLLAAAHATQSAARAVDLVYGVAGASAIYERSVIERCFRDAQVLRQHGFLNASRYETGGQVHLGAEPEFGFVAF